MDISGFAGGDQGVGSNVSRKIPVVKKSPFKTTVDYDFRCVKGDRDGERNDLHRNVGLNDIGSAQPNLTSIAHAPKAAITLEKQAVVVACGNRHDVAGHNLLGAVGAIVDVVVAVVVVIAAAQLTPSVASHAPQAAVTLEKQAVVGNGCDVAGHNLLRLVGVHAPQAA